METFFALLALCDGNPPVTGGPPTKANDAKLWYFIRSAPEQTNNETPMIWDAIVLSMTSL